jgi:trimethylamine--corrinoid protein Co-methyltransferase
MFEMGVAIRGSAEALSHKPVFAVIANAEPPLNISQHVAQLLMAAFQANLPCHLGNYNMMGITAPATVAGAVVQINAVQLVALILSQIVRSGVPFIYTAFSGDGNMRTLAPLASSPRALQQQRLAARLGHFYGLPIYGLAVTDANMPDSQAACETAAQMMLALEAGCNLIQGPTSMMDSIMLSSFAQAVIDNDIVGYVFASRLEPEISAETLALEAMHDVVTDPWLKDLRFAAHPHTVSHMRDNLWQPAAFAYDNVATGQRTDGQSVLERATAVARDILHHHQPEPLPLEVANEIRKIAEHGA